MSAVQLSELCKRVDPATTRRLVASIVLASQAMRNALTLDEPHPTLMGEGYTGCIALLGSETPLTPPLLLMR